MNSQFFTCHCGKSYKTKGWLEKHQEKCKKRNGIIDKPKKKKISPEIRFKIWEKYIGNKISAKCFCCWCIEITPFTSYNTFQGGHILSEFNGGVISLDNLLPICKWCNSAMGTQHWDEFIKINNYPPRLYGSNIPDKTINKINKIQIWWREIRVKKYKKKSFSDVYKLLDEFNIIIGKTRSRQSLKGYEMKTFSSIKKKRKKFTKVKKIIWY